MVSMCRWTGGNEEVVRCTDHGRGAGFAKSCEEVPLPTSELCDVGCSQAKVLFVENSPLFDS